MNADAKAISDVGQRVMDGSLLSREEGSVIARAEGEALDEVFQWSDRIRRKHFGNRVKFCSIVSGKLGGCGEDCAWCAQSARYKTKAPRKTRRADVPAVLKAAEEARQNHAACFCVVNSGRRPGAADLAALREINAALAGAGLSPACASMGELTAAAAAGLRAMGVRRYNHNLETSRRHFAELVTTHAYDDRLATLRAAKAAGLEVCCGGLFGTGDTWDDRIDLALTLREQVQPDIVPLNFLSPIPGTPLENAPPLTPLECLHTIALFRFLLPRTDLKIAGGRVGNLRDLQSWIFRAGATSLMVGNYLTTCGREPQLDRRMIEDLGMELVKNL